jgi:hypothetical protein
MAKTKKVVNSIREEQQKIVKENQTLKGEMLEI